MVTWKFFRQIWRSVLSIPDKFLFLIRSQLLIANITIIYSNNVYANYEVGWQISKNGLLLKLSTNIDIFAISILSV